MIKCNCNLAFLIRGIKMYGTIHVLLRLHEMAEIWHLTNFSAQQVNCWYIFFIINPTHIKFSTLIMSGCEYQSTQVYTYGDWWEGNRVTLRFGFLIAHSTQSPTLFTDEAQLNNFPYISYWHVIFYFHFQELFSLSEIPCLSLGDDFSTKYGCTVAAEHREPRYFNLGQKLIFEAFYYDNS